MKTFVKSLILVIFSVVFYSNLYGVEKIDSLYKIVKIKSKNDYFIIEATRNDSLFLILSQKNIDTKQDDKDFKNLEEIVKGKYHYFKLINKKLPPNVLLGTISYLHIKGGKKPFYGFVDGKTKIKYKKKYHYKIYETNNLYGLYYVSNYSP
jgi:hypothetical protein